MARKILNEVEKFYIREHKNLKAKEISSKMDGVGVKTVDAYLSTVNEGEGVADSIAPAQGEDEDPNRTKAGDLLARNKEYGVVLMTKDASEVSDEQREIDIKNRETSSNTESNDKIHRIRNE